ncbi:MAG: hypothetical protein ACI8QS_002290 [Planctomycetota bacterium]|jgi:hypothetical protein
MISINLLPPEYRQKKRTPIKLMIAVLASVTINGGLIAYWAWTAFGVAAEVESELALLEDTNESLKPQVGYHESLEKESSAFRSREEMLTNITSNRVSWTREVDLLLDVINGNGETPDYLIWLDDLSVDMKENKRNDTFGSMSASGHSGSSEFDNVANFLDDIEASRLSNDFGRPAPPEGSVSSEDLELVPSRRFSFPLEMNLRSPDERSKAAEQDAEGGDSK